MAETPDPEYEVDRVSLVDEQIRSLATRANELGLYDSYLQALRASLPSSDR